MTIENFNRIIESQEFDTGRTICGRRPSRGAMRLFRHRGKIVLASWNYAHGKWTVNDVCGGFGSSADMAQAARICGRPETITVQDAIAVAAGDGFVFEC